MTKEMKELLASIKAKKAQIKSFITADKLDEAEAANKDLEIMNRKYELLKAAYEEEEEEVNAEIVDESKGNKVDGFRLMIKAFNRTLTKEAAAPLQLITDGENGESYIVPEDVRTAINELRRNYKSVRNLVTVMPVNTLSGSDVKEDISTITGLTEFEDGAELPNDGIPKFTTVPWKLKQCGKIIPVSNRLAETEKGRLMVYIDKWFVKNAILTENTKVFIALAHNKAAKELADWKALRSSLNKDIDPDCLINGVIITNQNGFDTLDAAEDENGRPILEPNPANKTQKMFKGLPIEVFSNSSLPDVTIGEIEPEYFSPIFYGDTKYGINFYDRNIIRFASSDHALFTKNMKAVRIIEDIDVVQWDSDAYMYGLLPSTAPTLPEAPEPPAGD